MAVPTKELLVVGPFDWAEIGVSAADWPQCRVTEMRREADALELLGTRAFDVVVTNAGTSMSRVLGLARAARRLQPGVRVIVLAPELAPADIIAALRAEVFATHSIPAPAMAIRDLVNDALAADGWQNGIQVESAVPNWVSLRVSCRRVTAERLTHFMTELAGDVPETERYQLITAFREVLLNAMEHGAGFDPDKIVEVHAVRTRRTLVYYFKDPGPGFSPHAPKMVASETDPLSHLEERESKGVRPGGFGLMLASKLVDEVHFSERGNEVILVKHFDDGDAPAHGREKASASTA